MKKKNLLVAVASLIVGYVLGIVIAVPELDGNLLSGDIGKANRYSQQVVDPEIKALEEKLQNDETFLQGTVSTLIYMNARMEQFATLTDLTVDAAKDVEALKENVATLVGLKELAINAQTECGKAAEAVAAVSKGENANFENAMNRSTLAFLAVGKHIDAAKEFVEATDEVLASATQNRDALYPLAVVRDEWGAFCALEALVNVDKAEMAYWSKAKSMVESLGFQVNSNAEYVKNFTPMNNFTSIVSNQIMASYENSGLKNSMPSGLANQVAEFVGFAVQAGLENFTAGSLQNLTAGELQNAAADGLKNLAADGLQNGTQETLQGAVALPLSNQVLAQAVQAIGMSTSEGMNLIPIVNCMEVVQNMQNMGNAVSSGALGNMVGFGLGAFATGSLGAYNPVN